MADLRALPKLRDSMSYIYIEHAVIEKKDNGLLVLQETGSTQVPVANICVILLGPGTSITHAAVRTAGENGCSLLWVGEDAGGYYAQGVGETRRAHHLIRQSELVADSEKRLQVVLRMYEKRFEKHLEAGLSLEQIRGMEGARVRSAYQRASREYQVEWRGRQYDRSNWFRGDAINRALSAANAVLNGICHAAIVSGGYSPGLGFIHTGRMLSFVYDIADLYKTRFTIPIAFKTISEGKGEIEKRARQACREKFREEKLLNRILPDIDDLLDISHDEHFEYLEDDSSPEIWWDPIMAERRTS